jgi:hypothetical protein
MYKFKAQQTILPHEFFLPFGGKLNPENHWCKLAELIDWGSLESRYAKNFKDINCRTGGTFSTGSGWLANHPESEEPV